MAAKPVPPDDALGRLTRLDAIQSQVISRNTLRQVQAQLAKLEFALSRVDKGIRKIAGEIGVGVSVVQRNSKVINSSCVKAVMVGVPRSSEIAMESVSSVKAMKPPYSSSVEKRCSRKNKNSMSTSFLNSILIALLIASGQLAFGQSVIDSPPSGECLLGYFMFKGFCVNSEDLRSKGANAIVSEMMKLKKQPEGYPQDNTQIYLTKVDNDNGDVIKLENGAIVEIRFGYVGYIGYRKDALLFRTSGRWKLWIESKKVFNVDMIKSPISPSKAITTYTIERTTNDEKFVVNGEQYEAKVYCMNWDEGQQVLFLEGSAFGVCVSAMMFNLDRSETCDVWCE